MFTGWIHDSLRPHAAAMKVAHPLMLCAIAVEKKSYRIDVGRIADCLRLATSCRSATWHRWRSAAPTHSALPEAAGRQNVQLKNKIAQQVESGVSHNKEKLHQQGYFHRGSTREPKDDLAGHC